MKALLAIAAALLAAVAGRDGGRRADGARGALPSLDPVRSAPRPAARLSRSSASGSAKPPLATPASRSSSSVPTSGFIMTVLAGRRPLTARRNRRRPWSASASASRATGISSRCSTRRPTGARSRPCSKPMRAPRPAIAMPRGRYGRCAGSATCRRGSGCMLSPVTRLTPLYFAGAAILTGADRRAREASTDGRSARSTSDGARPSVVEDGRRLDRVRRTTGARAMPASTDEAARGWQELRSLPRTAAPCLGWRAELSRTRRVSSYEVDRRDRPRARVSAGADRRPPSIEASAAADDHHEHAAAGRIASDTHR